MRIAFLCKRRYMGKDVILDRYARLYEIPYQLALRGHEVRGCCLDYHAPGTGAWTHEAAPGSLMWESQSLGALKLPHLVAYPWHLLRRLRTFRPDLLIGASDIPHVALARWLSHCLGAPYAVDLYDNFEGFGQARIPGFVTALRSATRQAAVVTTTSEPLRQLVIQGYGAQGKVISMPSSVDLQVFYPGNRQAARQRLGLPLDARLVGTAGGLYRDKGVEPIYQAWPHLAAEQPDLHLVLAGPFHPKFPPPQGERVHYLGHLAHAQVADLFRALDVGIISILDTPFGRYCFPQKAYEMLACGLNVAVTDIGEMQTLFAATPKIRFAPADATGLAAAVSQQLRAPVTPRIPINDWKTLLGQVAPEWERLTKPAA
ncbi:MAG: glycosyltransferase family 4 protein [Burkholderiaceae bacterium]|jgi:glycosyltransferase involved in cell wall biosynthesis|nr:glycosyltransferase family 4 protein [Burkholderiaceae bacterium]